MHSATENRIEWCPRMHSFPRANDRADKRVGFGAFDRAMWCKGHNHVAVPPQPVTRVRKGPP
jgi:hypothetical protein